MKQQNFRLDFWKLARTRQRRHCIELKLVHGNQANIWRLDSVYLRTLIPVCANRQLGRRSFHVAAPVVWNSLPARNRAGREFHTTGGATWKLLPLVVDNSEMGLKPISFYKPTHDPQKTSVLRVYLLTYLFTYLWILWLCTLVKYYSEGELRKAEGKGWIRSDRGAHKRSHSILNKQGKNSQVFIRSVHSH